MRENLQRTIIVASRNWWVLLVALLAIGCQTGAPLSPTPTLGRPALARVTAVSPQTQPQVTIATAVATPQTAIINPTLTPFPTIPPSPSPTAITGPAFTNLRTAKTADAPPQSTFPAGTEEIYALWDFHNMDSSLRVMRLWLQDDLPWKVFEDYWDAPRYGIDGTVSDTYIYDYEGDGLPPGQYSLQLYIEGIYQGAVEFNILE